jgi:hypothetical protein
MVEVGITSWVKATGQGFAGVPITIDGSFRGNTPLSLDLPIGDYMMTVPQQITIARVTYRFIEYTSPWFSWYGTTTTMNVPVTDRTTPAGTSANILYLNYEVVPTPPGCFIATAAYGSPLAPQLSILRKFRDLCLPKKLTNAYYKVSPPIANFVSLHKVIRHSVRLLLEAIVKLIKRLI